ncbi:MAG: helix-hairpin-helix domain-containing protein, partial [Clostridia bacterium]|nr:helix-hairpin-helix domain-containing protein [Clostridia bacterium]
ELGIGDVISVYKANMIIPQIEENFTRSGNIEIPKLCPVCGADTYIRNENGTETLVCENPACPVKQLKAFSLFVSRDALNIDGLSEASLERLIGKGFIAEPADLFHLDRFKDEIIAMEGFGKKSYENLISACERACDTECYRLLYGLGIPNFGIANAKIIAKYCENKWEKIASLDEEELCQIDQIGKVMAKAYVEFFADENNQLVIEHLLDVLRLDESFETKEGYFEGLTFVITGSLEHFSNRNELKDMLEDAGAKVASSVSAKTSYLINNDLQSNSSKNKKAKELGVQIIDEETILDWIKAGKVQ